jgi:type II secretory pathway component GspD/PulD (secretin)
MRTFYISDATTPQEVNDLLNTVRVMFDVRYISPSQGSQTLTIRAPKRTLDLVTRLLTGMGGRKPQVMLHVQAFEVNRSMLRSLGIELPLQFQVFSLSAAALALAGQPDIQELIDELIATGGINNANADAIQALLAQLQNQQNSLLGQPIATFGGGLTLSGVTIPPITARAQLNESRVQRIDEALLRAGQGEAATLKSGVRFPILNATFAPIFNTPDLAKVIGEGTFQTPFPSFTYEDIGFTLKVTPRVQQEDAITLDFELQIRALGSQQINSIPVIVNREYKTAMTLKAGQPAAIAGMMGASERRAVRGIPGFSNIPVLGLLGSTKEKEEQETQLLVLVTPYIVGMHERVAGADRIYTRDLPQPGGSR